MSEKAPHLNHAEWFRQTYTGRTSKWHWFLTTPEGDGAVAPVCGANIIAEHEYGSGGIVWLEDVCRRCMGKLHKEVSP